MQSVFQFTKHFHTIVSQHHGKPCETQVLELNWLAQDPRANAWQNRAQSQGFQK